MSAEVRHVSKDERKKEDRARAIKYGATFGVVGGALGGIVGGLNNVVNAGLEALNSLGGGMGLPIAIGLIGAVVVYLSVR